VAPIVEVDGMDKIQLRAKAASVSGGNKKAEVDGFWFSPRSGRATVAVGRGRSGRGLGDRGSGLEVEVDGFWFSPRSGQPTVAVGFNPRKEAN
jgi:hypothetical protein